MIDPLRPPPGTPSIVRQGKHPAGYDVAREVLCSLPTGAPCDIRTLATDFRMPFPEMSRMLARLRERFGIAVSECSAMVTKKCRGEVERTCLDYWQAVYEGN